MQHFLANSIRNMIILVINCGSSSIKYQLLDMKSDDVYTLIAKGIVEKIGLPMGGIEYKRPGKDKIFRELEIPDHKAGMKLVLDALVDAETGVLKSFDADSISLETEKGIVTLQRSGISYTKANDDKDLFNNKKG